MSRLLMRGLRERKIDFLERGVEMTDRADRESAVDHVTKHGLHGIVHTHTGSDANERTVAVLPLSRLDRVDLHERGGVGKSRRHSRPLDIDECPESVPVAQLLARPGGTNAPPV